MMDDFAEAPPSVQSKPKALTAANLEAETKSQKSVASKKGNVHVAVCAAQRRVGGRAGWSNFGGLALSRIELGFATKY